MAYTYIRKSDALEAVKRMRPYATNSKEGLRWLGIVEREIDRLEGRMRADLKKK